MQRLTSSARSLSGKSRQGRDGLSGSVRAAAVVLGCGLALGIGGASEATASSLHQSLRHAYDFSPILKSQRAALRATDEGVSEAVGGYRPQITASGDYGTEFQGSKFKDPVFDPLTGGLDSESSSVRRPFGYTISLEQPIFQGKGIINSVRQAEANVGASRELLRDTENTVLLNAVTAYMNVIQDRALVRLQQNNLRVLNRELRATQDRFSVGEVTRTDVAQAQARSALARSNLDGANANLRSSRAAYRQVIGVDPMNLVEPRVPEKFLPHTLNDAINISLAENPEITQAVFNEAAARFAVAVADAAYTAH
ncbi:MAG: TolC family protein [Pseudomonadota bacterium]